MSRIYYALRRAAEQAKRRDSSHVSPVPTDGPDTPLPERPPSPTGLTIVQPTDGPDTPLPERPPSPTGLTIVQPISLKPGIPETAADPQWEQLKAEQADRIRVESWIRLEAATLRELGIRRFPRSDGVSAWLLEALGGLAVGVFLASFSLLLIFFIFIWLLHVHIPEVFP